MRSLLLFISLFCELLPAAGLSDLEIFSRTVQEMQKTYSDPKQKAEYRRALEQFNTAQTSVTRDFDKVFKELHLLWEHVDGVDKRLVKKEVPLAFQYKTGKETIFKFSRVTQPLQSVWLLQNLREKNTDVCSPRDNLFIDRWTPLLRDTTVFAIEKNGKYFGTTITLIPMKSGKKTYLLVVPTGNEEGVSPTLLRAFLKDYKQKHLGGLPFALLAKVSDGYKISSINEEGHETGTLGPLNGFTLEDPLAEKIVAVAPVECNPYRSNVAVGSDGSKGGTNGVSGSSANDPTMVVNINPSFNSQTNLSASASANLNAPKGVSSGNDLQRGGGRGNNVDPRGNFGTPRGLASPNSPTTITTNTINNLPNAKGLNVQETNGNNFRRNDLKPGDKGFSYLPPGFGTTSPNGTTGGSGNLASMGSGAMPSTIDKSRLSPSDKNILDAVDRAERALQDKERIPRSTLDEVFRGLDKAQDPFVKKQVEDSSIRAYLENSNPLEAYNSLRANKNLENLTARLNDDHEFCRHCKNCAYCIEWLKQNKVGTLK